MFDIQKSGTANRLNNPIAVIGSKEVFVHLCEICQVNPHNNDLFVLLQHPQDVKGATYSRVIALHGADEIRNCIRLASDAHAAIRN